MTWWSHEHVKLGVAILRVSRVHANVRQLRDIESNSNIICYVWCHVCGMSIMYFSDGLCCSYRICSCCGTSKQFCFSYLEEIPYPPFPSCSFSSKHINCSLLLHSDTLWHDSKLTILNEVSELSKYVCKLKRNNRNILLKWAILSRATAYQSGATKYTLCLEEKLQLGKGG